MMGSLLDLSKSLLGGLCVFALDRYLKRMSNKPAPCANQALQGTGLTLSKRVWDFSGDSYTAARSSPIALLRLLPSALVFSGRSEQWLQGLLLLLLSFFKPFSCSFLGTEALLLVLCVHTMTRKSSSKISRTHEPTT